MTTVTMRIVFWAMLAVFIGWDATHSAPIDLRTEPPLIAAGSGRPLTLGHCAIPGTAQ